MANLGGLVVTMGANLGPLRRKLALAKGQLKEFRTSVKATGRSLMNLGSRMSVAFTLPVVGAAAAATKAYSDFESEMIGISKTVDTSRKKIRDMSGDFMQLSEDTGMARRDIMDVAQAAGQLGIATQNIEEFTEIMTAMGVATDVTADEAAVSMARIANITGMSQSKFDRLGSTVVDLGNNMATFESRILKSAQRIAGMANTTGLTQDELVGLSAAVTSVVDRVQMGSTAMTRVLGKMNTAVMSGGDNLKTFASIAGTTTEQFQRAFEEDASMALELFFEGIDRLNEAGVDVAGMLETMTLGGQRALQAIMSLSGAHEELSKAMNLSGKAWKENNALMEEARKFYSSIRQQLSGIWEGIKNTVALLGEAFAPEIKAAIQSVKDFIDRAQKLVKGFKNMDESLKNLILRAGGFLAIIGPMTMVIGGLITVLGALLSPLAIVISALTTYAGVMVATGDGADMLSGAMNILKKAFEII